MPNRDLVQQWGLQAPVAPFAVDDWRADLEDQLLDWARDDEEVRRWIVGAWRQTHHEVVTAVEYSVFEGLIAASASNLGGFRAEHVLLSMLTGEFEDALELALTFVNSLRCPGQRRTLSARFGICVGGGDNPARRPRIVVVGGHQRDESRLGPRLFGESPYDVRWLTFVKHQGATASVQKRIASAILHADAALIITGMASHSLVHLAKKHAQQCGIPCQ